jgi:hypothetical protein
MVQVPPEKHSGRNLSFIMVVLSIMVVLPSIVTQAACIGGQGVVD